jgi:hypothetical protein
MTELPHNVIDELNARIEAIEGYDYITRDGDLQREECAKLDTLLAELAELKQAAITVEDEQLGNTLLGFECIARFLQSSLMMWILLKDGSPDEAWLKLVAAQSALADAARATPGFSNAAANMANLLTIEKTVFPPQKFTSWGFAFKSRICSICSGEYGEGNCNHLVGRPYMGRICHTEIREFELIDHLAMVKNPADKHSRIVSYSVPGGRKNLMTLRVEPGPPDNPANIAPGEASGQRHLIAQHISRPFMDDI